MNQQPVEIKRFIGGPLMTVCYLVAMPGSASLIVDAPRDAWRAALEAADNLAAPVQLAVATHGHWDHITDLAHVRALGIPTAAHLADRYMFDDPHGQGLNIPYIMEPTPIDRPLADGDVISIGGMSLRVLHTPGHTPGSICLWIAADDVIFSGDTLLKGGAGHTAEPGASLPALAASVRRLADFPERTMLYPGHGRPTRIGDEVWLETLIDPDAPLVQWRASNERRQTPVRDAHAEGVA